jgi:CheY-like chemotaxis protein
MPRNPSQRPTRPQPKSAEQPIGSPSSDALVLLVDGDRVTQRLVELALSKASSSTPTFSLEVANDAAAAFDIMSSSPVDLVISETSLADMNGANFIRKVKLERRLRDVPFVFLSANQKVEARVEAIRAGADAYLGKPCDASELVAYARALVTRRRASFEERGRRSYTLAGEFSALPFPDLVSILHVSRRCGVLSIITPFALGEVFFHESEIVHATFGSLSGEPAFFRLMSAESGSFEFAARDVATFPPRTVHSSVTALIMEGARLSDEAHSRQTPTAPLVPLPLTSESGVETSERHLLLPTKELGAAFERGIADPFVLGELRLFSRSELDAWARGGGAARLETCLITDLSEGVSTLLSVAAQSTESLILAGLSREPKVLGLSFHMRHERSLEVLLLDINNLGPAEQAMVGSPAVLIVAPPQGDFLAIGAKGTVELSNLVEYIRPAAVIGVGNAALPEKLAALPAVQRVLPPIRCLRGVLGVAEADLRAVLASGVRLWASTAVVPTSARKEKA